MGRSELPHVRSVTLPVTEAHFIAGVIPKSLQVQAQLKLASLG
jgi:hypothetical protein